MPERQSPTHEVLTQTMAHVVLRIPSQHVGLGEDCVRVIISGNSIEMSRQDWQQFVAMVNTASEQVSAVFDVAGRRIGRVV